MQRCLGSTRETKRLAENVIKMAAVPVPRVLSVYEKEKKENANEDICPSIEGHRKTGAHIYFVGQVYLSTY